ncbi:MAG: thioesterase domain-containing protein [Cellvibrionaceae bacterium]
MKTTDLKGIAPDESIQSYSERTVEGIPLLQNMQVHFEEPDNSTIIARAPLAPNINHKGIGFGGSLAALAAITGWSVVTRTIQRAGIDASTIIAHEAMTYRAPIVSDFYAKTIIEDAHADELLSHLRSGRRKKIKVHVVIQDEQGIGCEFTGTYVSIPTTDPGIRMRK